MIKVFSYQGLPQREVEGCAKLFFFHSHQIKEARNTLRAVERRGRKGRRKRRREGRRKRRREGRRKELTYTNHNQVMTNNLLTLKLLRWYVFSTAQPARTHHVTM